MTIEVTPSNTVSAEQVAAMVESACRAPSLHNRQPWNWISTAACYTCSPIMRGLGITPTSPARR